MLITLRAQRLWIIALIVLAARQLDFFKIKDYDLFSLIVLVGVRQSLKANKVDNFTFSHVK